MAIREGVLRDDWVVGAWYYNPMMEAHGLSKARFTKLCRVEQGKFKNTGRNGSSQLFFDEVVFPDGKHAILKEHLSQSNYDYENQMEIVEFEKIRPMILGDKFGI